MKQNRTSHLIGYGTMAMASLLFGINGTLSRLLFDYGVSPLTLVEFRMLIGALFLLLFLFVWKRSLLRLPFKDWGWVLLFGLAIAMAVYTYSLAISRLPLAVTLVIVYSAAVWMTLAETLWHRRLPSPLVLLTVGLASGGIVLLTGIWQQRLHLLDGVGLFYALLALLTYIGYLLVGRRMGRTIPALTSTSYGALVASLFWLVVQPPWLVPATTWHPQNFLLIVFVGIFGMALPFSFTLVALRHIDANRVSIVGMLELVVGSALAYFWLNQSLSIWQIAGCVLILASVIILQYEQQGS